MTTRAAGCSLRKKIGMSAGPNEDDFSCRDIVDQEPVRFDMALPNAFPLARQSVWLIRFRQGSGAREQLDRGEELLEILAPALLAPEIVSEPLSLGNPPHDATSQRAHLLCPGRNRIKRLQVPALACLPDGAPGFPIRDVHREGQAPGQLHLRKEG